MQHWLFAAFSTCVAFWYVSQSLQDLMKDVGFERATAVLTVLLPQFAVHLFQSISPLQGSEPRSRLPKVSAALALPMLAVALSPYHQASAFVRALVQNLRVPSRLGYTALAALRFVPRFRHELDVIRAAHRVRGIDTGRGPVAAVRRSISYAVPLLASAIRHAERVALAMEARAFGAHDTRTERIASRWRPRDSAFVALFWLVTAAIVWWGLLVV